MFLTLALLSRRWTPGKQWIGKHRRIKKFALSRKINQSKRTALARRVDKLISRPYLTVEEEANSSMVSNRKWSHDKMMEAKKRFKPLVSGHVHLNFLKTGQKY